MIERIDPTSIGLTFRVAPGNDAEDDLGRIYRPRRVTVTIGTWVRVEIGAVKIKKDGTDSLTTVDPYYHKDNYPPFVLAAIKATQAYILKAQEANAS